jgi:hypothetical protein
MNVGKIGSQKHALGRHHDHRKKAWVRRTLGHYFIPNTAEIPANRVGMYSRTPKVCSCYMCGNPRRFHGEVGIQERRTMIGTDEFVSEIDTTEIGEED